MSLSNDSIVDYMPSVGEYTYKLSSLSKELQKTVLTGKISSLEVAETLFAFMENTQIEFANIQKDLVKNLINENMKKLTLSVSARAQAVVDVLVRNLFERTADVGFLATDDDIIKFLHTSNPSDDEKAFMHQRLQEYVLKYSVYDEIVLLKPDGTVAMNLDKDNPITHSQDPIISETLTSHKDFCECYRFSDLQPEKSASLIYTAKIQQDSEPLGILCLCFKIDNEMQMIYDKLELFSMNLALLSAKGAMLNTNKNQHPSQSINIRSYGDQPKASTSSLELLATSEGYQGYMGQNWYGYAKVDYHAAFKNAQNENLDIELKALEKTNIISKELKAIKSNAEEILDDLSDVVINGEIIASKRRTYSLNPILDNIRKVSESIHEIINHSIQNIYFAVAQSHINNLSFRASLCVDIMDRNLYERANDCRWWALNTTFRRMLENKEAYKEEVITSILEYINSLYTVYTNLFIYDKSHTIIAVSNPLQREIIGTKVAGEAYTKTLVNRDSQTYFVSPFETTPLYDNRATYIYNASITSLDEPHECIGGIGIVFDSEPEFHAMLDDVIVHEKECALFCDKDARIISSTANCFSIGEVFDPIKPYIAEQKFNIEKIITIEGKSYLIGMAKSSGYREYKIDDAYKNDVYCVMMIEIA